ESEKIQTPSHEEFHYTEQPEQKDNVDQENLSSNTTASVDTKVGSKNRIDILGWLKNYLEQDDATK
ncbi:MAG: hypothetical protein ACKO8Q_06335, partial [Bacteroidota bacterium]